MAKGNQKTQLAELLDDAERAHKTEIQLYLSGHLNHNKLFKPSRSKLCNYWVSSKKPTLILPKKDHLGGPHKMPEEIRSRINVTLKSMEAKSVSKSLFVTADKIQKKEAPVKEEGGPGIVQKQLIREELDIPEMKLLKYKPTKNSRLCVTKEIKEEYQFLPSYLAGVTKNDQYNNFMQFQKDYIAKQDLLENDYIGSKSAEHHERKLAQALQNICDCNRPHFNRLQAVGEVFEDICNSSLIFGDILKEVKNEYELYMVILLDSMPSLQYRTLQNEVKGMKKRIVMTHEIEEGRHEIQVLLQNYKLAIARNEDLRNKLEIELWVSQTDSKEKEEDGLASKEECRGSAALMKSLRCQIIMKWEEIQAMEREIKNTMTFNGIINIKEKTVKELESEISKLQSSNKFLIKQIKDVENSITTTLKRNKFNISSQKYLWGLVKDFLTPQGEENQYENLIGPFP